MTGAVATEPLPVRDADPTTRPDEPKFVRTYATDATVEKLLSLLSDNPRGLLYHRDELVAWVASFNQYRDRWDKMMKDLEDGKIKRPPRMGRGPIRSGTGRS